MALLKHIDFQVPAWGELQQPPASRTSYRGEVMADSPLMYLRLGESSGSTAADETGQHDAQEDGALSWGVQGPLIFDDDTAVESSGTGGFIINQTGWLPTGSSPRTVELWFKPTLSTTTFRGINYGGTGVGEKLSFIYTHNDISVAVNNCRFGAQGLSLADQWHHTALVYPSGASRCDEFLFYLDGQPLSASVIGGSGSTTVNTTDSSLLINAFVPGIWNHGAFDEVAIYGTALSAQRILEHYEAGALA